MDAPYYWRAVVGRKANCRDPIDRRTGECVSQRIRAAGPVGTPSPLQPVTPPAIADSTR